MFTAIFQAIHSVKGVTASPENLEVKANFCEKLMTYGVSLKQYEAALAQDDITM